VLSLVVLWKQLDLIFFGQFKHRSVVLADPSRPHLDADVFYFMKPRVVAVYLVLLKGLANSEGADATSYSILSLQHYELLP